MPLARQPQTMIGFLRSLGGLRDCDEMRHREARKTWPGLVNNRHGLPLDRAREACAEQGYLPMDTSVAQFLDALDAHPLYRYADGAQLADWRAQCQNVGKPRLTDEQLARLIGEANAEMDAWEEFDAVFSERVSIEREAPEPAPIREGSRGADALAWRKRMGLSRAKLAIGIGFSPSQIQDYEEGERRGKVANATISGDAWRRYALACAAYEMDLKCPF